jgi:hypothetical protein
MAVDLQTLLVYLAAGAALLYLARGLWRTWAGKGCGSGCGSCGRGAEGKSSSDLIPVADLLVRGRRGGGATS